MSSGGKFSSEEKKFDIVDLHLEDEPETFCETVISCRWVMSYIGCLCFTILYALRINLGIAMVCMVKAPNITEQIDSENTCDAQLTSDNKTAIPISGDIEWDKTTQGWVLSSFFYGYIVTQIPSGYLAGRYGGKKVMLVGMTIYGIATLLVPVAARFNGRDYVTSAWLVIALRVIMGLSTAVSFPAMHCLWGKWAPPYERSKLLVLCYSGTMIGNVLMLGVGGYFCEWTNFDGGWPSMFYLGGALCLVFCVLWTVLVYDSPLQHPRISTKERNYILQSIEGKQEIRNTTVPWKAIFTSPAMWAIIVAHCANNFGNYTLITKLPAFMKEVLQFDIKENGLYSALPYIAMFLVANTMAQLIDKLREKGILSTVNSRKVCMAIALVIPAGFLVGTGFITCNNRILGVVFLTLAVAFTGFNRSGYNVNHVDIAPRYAGELFGITNTFATIPGMVAPSLVNAMTPNGTALEWQRVFYVWASVFVFGAIFYSIFARGEVQKWALDSKGERVKKSRSKISSKKGTFTLEQLDN